MLVGCLALVGAACSPQVGGAPPPPAASAPGTPTAPSSTPGMAGGAGFSEPDIFWDSDAQLAQHLDGIAATGAQWLRIDISWSMAEGTTQGVFDWSVIDRVVTAARTRGLSILGILDTTPPWARSSSSTTQWYPPTNPSDYAAFAEAAAQHFAAPQGGVSGPAIRTWEIWNEPNNPIFWSTGADPAVYTQLLIAAGTAIKAVDASATVLTGGLAPTTTGGGWMDPVDFLNGVYAAGGGGHFDGVAYHPYTWPNLPSSTGNNFTGVTPQLYTIMSANGDGGKRIWGTEVGAPEPWTGSGVTLTPQFLASYVTAAYSVWRAWQWTGPLIWFSYSDTGTSSPSQVFGLTDENYVPKQQAVSAYTTAIGG